MALSYMQKQKNPTGQLARYLDLIADYDFSLEHRPGKIIRMLTQLVVSVLANVA